MQPFVLGSFSIRRGANLLLDAVLPPRCLACGVGVALPGHLCADCWMAVDFIAPPFCACCGAPFPHDFGPNALCIGCAGRPPVFDAARAAINYGAVGRKIILGFKHHDRTSAAPALANWLLQAGGELITRSDVISPVPLHWVRQFFRKYNQSALLARRLGDVTGLPVVPDLLVRTRRTAVQARLPRSKRVDNLRGAFAVKPSLCGFVAGRRVLLNDDVMTTGATVGACCKVLRNAGAAEIRVLTLARVLTSGGIRVPKIEIYTTPFCPFCHRAKALLRGKGVAFDEIDVMWRPALRLRMKERAMGRHSVPQIFVDGALIGGSDELAALDDSGELDRLLKIP